VADAALFRELESGVAQVLEADPGRLEEVVVRCVAVKGRIVARDERDAGPRAALNFGHTLGHALEAATAWRFGHGPAVAVGMAVEAVIASPLTGFPDKDVTRLVALLDAFGLPTEWPAAVSPDAVVAAARADKKAREGRIRCALPARIGRMPGGGRWTTAVTEEAIRSALASRAAP
jgi:3-dehydroquinate synthetase